MYTLIATSINAIPTGEQYSRKLHWVKVRFIYNFMHSETNPGFSWLSAWVFGLSENERTFMSQRVAFTYLESLTDPCIFHNRPVIEWHKVCEIDSIWLVIVHSFSHEPKTQKVSPLDPCCCVSVHTFSCTPFVSASGNSTGVPSCGEEAWLFLTLWRE